MATRISDMLPADTPLAGDELLEVSLPGSPFETRSVTSQDLADLAAAGLLDTDGAMAADSDLVAPSQKATRTYVDAKLDGRAWKQAVRAATTAAGTLASDFENGDTIDGVALVTGDRILIKDQAAPAANGIYVVAASGAPSRATDASSGAELVNATVYVSEGTTLADTQWTCTTNAPITVDATALAFAQSGTGGAGTVTHTGGALTQYAVAIGNGSDDLMVLASLGAAGEVLTSNGIGAAPSFQAAAGGGGSGTFVGAMVKLTADLTGQNYNAGAVLSWGAEEYDTDGFHDNSTNPTRLTVPAGVTRVRVSGGLRMDGLDSSAQAQFIPRKNGSLTFIGRGGQSMSMTASVAGGALSFMTPVLEVTPGDYFEAYVSVNTDITANVTADRSYFAIEAVNGVKGDTGDTGPAGASDSITGTTGATGGPATATGGTSTGAGNAGGEAIVVGGAPGADGAGGAASLTGGAGNGTGNGGAVSVTGGSASGGTGGKVALAGGAAGGGNRDGGDVALKGGAPSGTGARGNVVLNDTGAALSTTATGGFVTIPTCAGTPSGVPANVPTGNVALVFDTTNLRLWMYSGGAWVPAHPQPFDMTGFYPGLPTSSAFIVRVPVARAISFAANFAASQGKASANATGSTAFDLQKNGVSVGTMTFAAGAASATFTSSGGAAVSFAAGDVLSVIAPATPDATLADVGLVLAGTR